MNRALSAVIGRRRCLGPALSGAGRRCTRSRRLRQRSVDQRLAQSTTTHCEALRVVGLTAGGQLVCFSDRKPQRARCSARWPASPAATAAWSASISGRRTACSTAWATPAACTASTRDAQAERVGQLSTPPDAAATAFGVDFNPAANALRIVANSGQNLRQSFANLGTATRWPPPRWTAR